MARDSGWGLPWEETHVFKLRKASKARKVGILLKSAESRVQKIGCEDSDRLCRVFERMKRGLRKRAETGT